MPQIGLLINELDVGGAEILLWNFLRYLANHNGNQDNYVVFTLQGTKPLGKAIERLGYQVIDLNIRWRWDLTAVERLSNLIQEHRIDLLHAHLPRSGIFSRLAARRVGLRAVLYTEHSVWSRHKVITRLLNRLTISMTKKIIAVSEAVRRSILEKTNLSPSSVVVIPNGIDASLLYSRRVDADNIRRSLGIPSDAYVVGNVASISPVKGHLYLVEAVAKLRLQYSNVYAVIVGRDAGSRKEVMDKIREVGLRDNVILTGYRSDAIEIIQAFDVFVLPSLFEGMPVALLEAMALGKPVIVTAVGGNVEVVRHSIEGLVVPPSNSEALSTAIRFFIENPDVADACGHKAQERVKSEFTLERMVMRYLRVYEEILEG